MTLVEATAPASIDLAGTPLDVRPPDLRRPAVAVGVAVDRRAWCRVETGRSGVRIESKDSLTRAEGPSARDLAGRPGAIGLAARILDAVGLSTGVEAVTQSKVPEAAGLGASASLAVAVVGAASRAAGLELSIDAACRLAREAVTPLLGVPPGLFAVHAAFEGGVVALRLEPGGSRLEALAADPGRIEECLLLVQPAAGEGATRVSWEVLEAVVEGDEAARRALEDVADRAQAVSEALAGHRYDEVAERMAAEWTALKSLAPGAWGVASSIEALARPEGGAARPCGGGAGSLVAVWACPGARGPGSRERVEQALRSAGHRLLPFRVDLRGLAVE